MLKIHLIDLNKTIEKLKEEIKDCESSFCRVKYILGTQRNPLTREETKILKIFHPAHTHFDVCEESYILPHAAGFITFNAKEGHFVPHGESESMSGRWSGLNHTRPECVDIFAQIPVVGEMPDSISLDEKSNAWLHRDVDDILQESRDQAKKEAFKKMSYWEKKKAKKSGR